MMQTVSTRTVPYMQIGDRSADAGHTEMRLFGGVLQARDVAYPTSGKEFASPWQDLADEAAVGIASRIEGAIPAAINAAITAAARRSGMEWAG